MEAWKGVIIVEDPKKAQSKIGCLSCHEHIKVCESTVNMTNLNTIHKKDTCRLYYIVENDFVTRGSD